MSLEKTQNQHKNSDRKPVTKSRTFRFLIKNGKHKNRICLSTSNPQKAVTRQKLKIPASCIITHNIFSRSIFIKLSLPKDPSSAYHFNVPMNYITISQQEFLSLFHSNRKDKAVYLLHGKFPRLYHMLLAETGITMAIDWRRKLKWIVNCHGWNMVGKSITVAKNDFLVFWTIWKYPWNGFFLLKTVFLLMVTLILWE